MRTLALLTMCFLAGTASASVQSIPGLYNTGVDNLGSLLLDGTVDSHYSISSFPVLSGATGDAYTYQNLNPLYAFYPGSWVANTGASQWIGPALDIVEPSDPDWAGDFHYDLQFDLAGLNEATASISGEWSSDNGSFILLNGIPTGIVKSGNGYGAFDSFTITTGFVSGVNTLTFVVNNELSAPPLDPNPSGVQVNRLVGTANAAPEPATLLVWGGLLATGGVVAFKRRK